VTEKQILPVYYFAPISYWAFYLQVKKTIFEREDFYEKQSFRNRCYLYGANGWLSLIIPIRHEGKRKYKDVRICYEIPWRTQHQKSLENAYRSSPYFKFYEMDFIALFEKKEIFLLDFNQKCMQIIANILKITLSKRFTYQYQKKYTQGRDLRDAFSVKSQLNQDFPKYQQVFSEKHGFFPDLSLLDLLFNEGPESFNYLKKLHT